ncbi:FixH family protein [Aquibium sp. A9E412]|uniref:FixH family protein n=1 Tax=Aquibium sp. A9E412 TaxID=2976767 RepID=UPI0025B08F04|nr:FixH family protein [Aquibium sp. A9E412]MDN2566769.1 FixH family protein [Aquibium sp. A9E412]
MRHAITALGIAVAVVAIYLAVQLFTPPPAEPDLGPQKSSAAGLFTVALAPEREPVPMNALHGWTVTVTTPDGAPVTDATLAIDGGMPAHGHGLPTAPTVGGHLGEGRYRVEGMRFNMGGLWELRVRVETPRGGDEAVFDLML